MFNARLASKLNFEMIDITQFVGKGKSKRDINRIYFCNTTYPSQEEMNIIHHANLHSLPLKQVMPTCFKSSAFKKLATDLKNATSNSGFVLIRNGCEGKLNSSGYIINQRFACQQYQSYTPSTNLKSSTSFRKHTFHNDRKNHREDGRKLCRQRNSKLAKSKCSTCRFSFRVSFDFNGFYVAPGLGNCKHSGHSKIGNNVMSYLDDVNEQFIKDMGEGYTRPSCIQNAVFNKTGKLISRSAIRHITGYSKRNIDGSDFDGFF